MIIFWGSVWGVWDRYRVCKYCGVREGEGARLGDRHWGCQYLGGGGLGTEMGMPILWG